MYPKAYSNQVGIILQARMGSKRLPGKVLEKIDDKSIIEHIIESVFRLKHKFTLVIATSIKAKDDVLEAFCRERNLECFRGSEENVLERFYMCAIKYRFQHIVRLTADNPLVDIEELDNLIELHLSLKPDYSSSLSLLPKGAGAEIFSIEALKKSYLYANQSHHLEHVNEFILENPHLFNMVEMLVLPQKRYPNINLSVDTKDDLDRIKYIFKNSSKPITTQEAISLCLQYA